MGQICRLFGLTRQAYYQYFWRQQELQFEEELVLKQVLNIRIRQPMIGTRKLYGMLQDFLIKHQIKIGRDALFDLLENNGMLVRRRKRSVKTTFSSHWLRKYPNLIEKLEVLKPNNLWVADITYLETENGFLYLSLLTDAYSRKIVGYHVADNLMAVSSVAALKMALNNMPRSLENLIHHSDRGIQYCSSEYVNLLQDYKIKISMTQTGDPRDNAIAERVNGTIKNELLAKTKIENLEDADKILKTIVMIYNNERPHLSIALMTPQKAHETEGEIKKYWKNYRAVNRYKKQPVNV